MRPSLSLASEESPARVIVLPVKAFMIHADEEQGGEWTLSGCCNPKEVRPSSSCFVKQVWAGGLAWVVANMMGWCPRWQGILADGGRS